MDLSQISINSYRPLELSNFLSYLFDIEIKKREERYYLFFRAYVFVISTALNKPEHSMSLTFQLESLQALEDLIKKYEFYLYRETGKPPHKKMSPQKEKSEYYFEIFDVDGRSWFFSYLEN